MREMYPQLDFLKAQNYAFAIESITTDQLNGCFYLKDFDSCYPFNGLLSIINNHRYHVTFSINWTHEEAPSYTVFAGHLILEMDKESSIMELNWLHVRQGIEATHSRKGFFIITNQLQLLE